MPKRIASLSEMQVRNAKPQAKKVTLFEGGGLFLLVTPTRAAGNPLNAEATPAAASGQLQGANVFDSRIRPR
jgi:hypothetical protein